MPAPEPGAGAAVPPAISAALEPVVAAVRNNDLATAKRLARQALDRGLEHPMLLNLRALEAEEAGHLKQALADLRRAHLLAPRDFAILNACGVTLTRMERYNEALNCYDQALAIEPRFAPGWFNRGWALERVGEKGQAELAYARAVELKPDHVLAWACLAFLSASRGDAKNARLQANKALALQPELPTALIALAATEMGQPTVAEARLRGLLATSLTTYDRALVFGLLGDALDAQERTAEAFAAYSASNAELRKESAPRFEIAGQPTIAASVLQLIAWAERLDPKAWRSAPGSVGQESGHVFLMGFPRSGTTLMESMLGQHPDIVTLEERETLHDAVLAFLDDPKDLAGLADAPESRLRPLRDDYWSRVAQFGVDTRGKVFIDKNPFSTFKLPVIVKLFPEARILFAIRDPRDVVLSCFRRRFGINPSTYEYLDLSRTAHNYDGAMRLADLMRTKLRFAEHQLVYERLVANFEAEARTTCDFIGVDWRDDLIDFAGRARRGEIASASAAQIARGLYGDGSGHWRRYRAQMEPVLPTLEPWVRRFGYPGD
jgi:tetratricopeptide (TPR) repeat protein